MGDNAKTKFRDHDLRFLQDLERARQGMWRATAIRYTNFCSRSNIIGHIHFALCKNGMGLRTTISLNQSLQNGLISCGHYTYWNVLPLDAKYCHPICGLLSSKCNRTKYSGSNSRPMAKQVVSSEPRTGRSDIQANTTASTNGVESPLERGRKLGSCFTLTLHQPTHTYLF